MGEEEEVNRINMCYELVPVVYDEYDFYTLQTNK